MKYVLFENDLPKTVVSVIGYVPKNSIPCPEETRNVAELNIINNNGELTAVLDPIKIAEYDSYLASQQNINLEKQNILKKRARLDFGMDIKAEVMVLNESKNWNQATWNAYMQNENVKMLSALLVDGYLQTALNLLNTVDLSLFYDLSEVQTIANKIQNYLAAE